MKAISEIISKHRSLFEKGKIKNNWEASVLMDDIEKEIQQLTCSKCKYLRKAYPETQYLYHNCNVLNATLFWDIEKNGCSCFEQE